MLSKSVGIYIDRNDIYIIVLNRSLGNMSIATADKAQIPTSDDRDKAISITLRDLFSRHNIKERSVTVGMAAEDGVVRYFEMPRLNQAQQEAAVPLAARKYLPFKIEDICSDFSVSYEGALKNNMAVQFLAAEKATVERYLSIFEDAGLKVQYLEVVPFALNRLFNHVKIKTPKDITALMQIGSRSANISIFKGSTLYLTRNIPLAEEIPVSGSLDVDRYKPVFDMLTSEIQLSFDYLHRQFPNVKIPKIFVCAEEGFGDWVLNMSNELGVEGRLVNPVEAFEGTRRHASDFAIPLGLALRGFSEPSAGLNVAPPLKSADSRHLLKTAVACGLIGIVALAGVKIFVSKNISHLEAKLRQEKNDKSEFCDKISSMPFGELKEVKSEQAKQLLFLENIIDGRLSLTEKISRLNALASEEMWLSDITSSYERSAGRGSASKGAHLLISGFAYTTAKKDPIEMINAFLSELKNDKEFSEGFGEIKLDSVSKSNLEGFEVTGFRILCRI